MIIELEDWFDAGYTLCEIKNRDFSKLADFLLQKKFTDEEGIRYYITVYTYDRTKVQSYYHNNAETIERDGRYGYMPHVQFNLGNDKPFFEITMNAINSIREVEVYYEDFWCTLLKPYCVRYK